MEIRCRRAALSVSCPCLVFVRIYRKIVLSVGLLPGFCPDFLSGSVCPDCVCLGSVSCPDSVRIIEKSCPLSVCPAGQGRDGAVRTFTVLVRRRLMEIELGRALKRVKFKSLYYFRCYIWSDVRESEVSSSIAN